MALKDPYLYDDSGGDYGTDKSNLRLPRQASNLDAQAVADRAPVAPKVAAKKTPAPIKKAPRRARADDGYDPNLDPNAQVGVTARAVQGPGGMQYQNAERGQTFKKGGSVRGRGDGIAQRGHTKGRFV